MKKVVRFLMFSLLLAANAAIAQEETDARIESLEKRMEAMRRELEELKRKDLGRKIDNLLTEIKEIEGREKEVTAGHDKHFYIKSSDDMFKIDLLGRVYLDGRMYEGGPIEPIGGADFNDTFSASRARIGVMGYIWGKPHRFKVEADFTYDHPLRDGYFELAYVPWLKVKFGQFKVPFSREYLQSTLSTQFVERALITDNLQAGRDIGIMVHGELFDGYLDYATGVFNGAGSNTLDDNDAKDWAYRFVLHPFEKTGNAWLEGFELGHSLTIGNQPEGPSLRGRTAGDVDFFPRVTRQGTRTRTGVDAAWYVGPFSLIGEYIHVDEHRGLMQMPPPRSAFVSKLGSLEHEGWYTTVSYLLTGEKKTAKHVIPKANFDPIEGGWGAWEIACRIEQLRERSRDILFTDTYVDPWGTVRTRSYDHQQDTALTFGINWYLNPNMTLKVNWIHDWFGERVDSPEREIDTVLTRFQIYW